MQENTFKTFGCRLNIFETEVMHSRISASRPETGIVTFEHRAFKQSGEIVCRCRRNALMHCIPSENKLDND